MNEQTNLIDGFDDETDSTESAESVSQPDDDKQDADLPPKVETPEKYREPGICPECETEGEWDGEEHFAKCTTPSDECSTTLFSARVPREYR